MIPSRTRFYAIRQISIRIVAISLFFVSATISVLPIHAQEASSGISGTISDPSAAKIAGAKITARNTATNLTIQTASDASGFYEFTNLPAGEYVLSIHAQTFDETNIKAFRILLGQRANVDATLKIGNVTVEVAVAATAVELMDTTTNALGNNVEPIKIDKLPLNQRNLLELIDLQPGVNTATNTGQTARGGFEINGAPGLNNNILLDGIDATFGENNGAGTASAGAAGASFITIVGLGAIQEFRTTTSVPSVQYGRASGGILTINTKSGSNAFHGGVFEFFRNDVLDANTWTNKHQAVPVKVPELRFNEFGANLGGPIKRDKAFFFFNYEGDRVASGTSTKVTVPTPLLISSVSNPSIAQELSFLPAPTTQILPGALTGQFVGNLSTLTDENTYLARADVNLGKHRVFARYDYNNQTQTQQQYRLNNLLTFPLLYYNAALADTWIPTSHTTNDLRVGFNRTDLARHNSTYTSDPFQSYIAVTSIFNSDANQALLHFETNTYNLIDNFMLLHGRHTITLGTDNRWLRSARAQDSNNLSTYSSVANLEVDKPTSITLTFPVPQKQLDAIQFGFYAEDNFRATSRVSLNYGVRYDYYTPLTGLYNVTASDPFSPLSTDKSKPYISSGRFDIAPRVGVILDILGNKKLVFRSGFGLMFLPPQPFFFYDSAALDPRLPATATITSSDVPAGTSLAFPFSKAFVNMIAANPSTLPADILLGRQIANPKHAEEYSENWNGNLQWAAAPGLLLQATYSSLQDLHGITTTLPNQFAPHTCPTTATCGARPNPTIGNINYDIFEGRTTYDAMFLQASYRRGVNLVDVYYTFASSIEEWATNQSGGNAQSDVQDLLNPAGSRGWSAGTTRNRLNTVVTTNPPVPSFLRSNRFARTALEGYSIQGIARWNSGYVGNVRANIDLVRNGRVAADRPDRVQGVSMYTSGTDSSGYLNYLNPNAFDNTTPFNAQRYGNLGYDAIYGPHQISFNASLIREIHIAREHSLFLRAEFFDVFNHPNNDMPDLVLPDASFGKVITRSSSRNIQFGAVYKF